MVAAGNSSLQFFPLKNVYLATKKLSADVKYGNNLARAKVCKYTVIIDLVAYYSTWWKMLVTWADLYDSHYFRRQCKWKYANIFQ